MGVGPGRPERVRVLHAVALEQAVATVVHLDGELHHHLALRLREDDLLVVPQSHHFRRDQQLLRRLVEEVARLRRDADLLEDARGDRAGGSGDGGAFHDVRRLSMRAGRACSDARGHACMVMHAWSRMPGQRFEDTRSLRHGCGNDQVRGRTGFPDRPIGTRFPYRRRSAADPPRPLTSRTSRVPTSADRACRSATAASTPSCPRACPWSSRTAAAPGARPARVSA